MGLNFHKEDWLGGYGSQKRRLYRLGHISFFGLATANLLFYLTSRVVPVSGWALSLASWSFAVGAVCMPVCCFLMAQNSRWRWTFAVPVTSLLTGGIITLWEVIVL